MKGSYWIPKRGAMISIIITIAVTGLFLGIGIAAMVVRAREGEGE